MIKTKIICTLGPACDCSDMMEQMILAGMDCARFNFSHGSHEEHLGRLVKLRAASQATGRKIAALLDTKGPEIRTGSFNGKVELVKASTFTIVNEDIEGDETQCSVSYKNLHKDVTDGALILIDDGLVGLRVEEIRANGDIVCKVENGGVVSSRKGINVPGCKINLPAMTEQDIADIKFGVANDYDFIAVSFVRKAADVLHVRRLLEHIGGEDIKIVAKIENREGVDNFDEILRAADGIMVARGDLGVEIPVEEVPIAQKIMITKTYRACKFVITATQMLDSMMRNPRPTRAETSDVANAIFDGTSCIMLSGETASGSYPLESLQTMVKIAQTTECSIKYWKRFSKNDFADKSSVTDAISLATCTTAMNLNAAAIITVSKTGKTARDISRFRPQCPIVCATTSEKVVRQLHLAWGVQSYFAGEVHSTDDLFATAMRIAEQSELVTQGDLTVITAGVPVGIAGTTNMLKVQMFGNVLCSGQCVVQGVTTGELCIAMSKGDIQCDVSQGQIMVVDELMPQMLHHLRNAVGLIVEGEDKEGHALSAGLTLEIPVIVSAAGATTALKAGTVVTMDATRGIIYHE